MSFLAIEYRKIGDCSADASAFAPKRRQVHEFAAIPRVSREQAKSAVWLPHPIAFHEAPKEGGV
jgi:hypothetical protein